MTNKRIAIIFHENNRRRTYRDYMITDYSKYWRHEGFNVFFLFGTNEYVPADLAIMNVDLSVVPESYIEFGKRYPITLNGDISDIRKSSFSKLLVKKDDLYSGQVIVKTDLNCHGLPEKRNQSLTHKLAAKAHALLSGHSYKKRQDYKVYEKLEDVPDQSWENPALVVEKFIPEKEDELYCIRTCVFFGDRLTSHRLRSHSPLVKFDNCIDFHSIDPHSDVLAYRKLLGFDFGKFDYVVHDNKATVFDINKTPGTGHSHNADPLVEAMRKHKAEGIYSFFK
jgi:hypothetical protein